MTVPHDSSRHPLPTPPRSVRRRHHRRRRAGFTLIEVMIAMTLLVSGTIAIVQMQRVALRSVTVARELATATQLAQNVLEQLKLDAVTWTQPGIPPALMTDPNVLGRTTWLNLITANPRTWITMPPPPDLMTAGSGADFFGRTVAALPDAHYCTNIRLTWVQLGRTMRADVRVFFRDPEGGGPSLVGGITNDCLPPDNLAAGSATLRQIHIVYASTVIRVTEPR